MRKRHAGEMTPGHWILVAIVATVLVLALAIERLTRIILRLLKLLADKPVRLVIVPKGAANMDFPPIEPGATAGFDVIGVNKNGKPVPLVDAVVIATDDAAIATATVDADGKNGVLTGVAEGSTTLRATSGALVATPAAVTVAADNVAVSIAIVPK